MIRLEKPVLTMDTIKRMHDMTWFTHALIFDDLLIVSQKETNCFVLKSSEGLIVIDAIWPCRETYDAVIEAIEDVGWNPSDLDKLVLTHGHADHTGCGKWLVKEHQVKTYLSETDDEFWREHPIDPEDESTWKNYDIDYYVKDKDVITSGDKKIYVYETPGHTPGGLSFIFNVTEDGVSHQAALWGGSNPPYKMQGIITYMKSLDYFMREARKQNVEIALSNHTSLDNGLERIAYSQKRMSYMSNIYLIGAQGFQDYCQLFRNLCYDNLERISSDRDI